MRDPASLAARASSRNLASIFLMSVLVILDGVQRAGWSLFDAVLGEVAAARGAGREVVARLRGEQRPPIRGRLCRGLQRVRSW